MNYTGLSLDITNYVIEVHASLRMFTGYFIIVLVQKVNVSFVLGFNND